MKKKKKKKTIKKPFGILFSFKGEATWYQYLIISNNCRITLLKYLIVENSE